MAIQKGQQLWKLRKKHGPDRKFGTPEELWKAACKYFEWCDNNPLIEEDILRSGDTAGQKIYLNKMRPYTLQALCIHLGVDTSYLRKLKDTLKKEDSITESFLALINKVESIVYTQKFEGAAAGFFNANIIARDLGLRDKKDIDNTIKIGHDLEEDEEYI